MPKRAKGFTLIEILLTFAVSSGIFVIAFHWLSSANNQFNAVQQKNKTYTQGQTALKQITNDIKLIDFLENNTLEYLIKDNTLLIKDKKTAYPIKYQVEKERSPGLYRSLNNEKELILPNCTKIQINFWAEDANGSEDLIKNLHTIKKILYADIELTVRMDPNDTIFYKRVYINYILL